MTTLVLIPARLASTRLPDKPLADIAGAPMIVHVARRATESGLGRVVVATDAPEVATAVRAHGFEAVMTGTHHQSGSDRIFEGLQSLDPSGDVGSSAERGIRLRRVAATPVVLAELSQG